MKQLKEKLQAIETKNLKVENMLNQMKAKGFLPVEVSNFEDYDAFIQCKGRLKKEKTVKVINKNGAIGILRPDITFNIIKEFAPYMSLEDELKVCYYATTFEDGQDMILEKKQIGAEYLGQSNTAEADIVSMVNELLTDEPTILVLGHTDYIRGLLKEVYGEEEIKNEILMALFRKQSDSLKELLALTETDEAVKEKIVSLLEIKTKTLEDYKSGYMNPMMRRALEELAPFEAKGMVIDLAMVSMFDYYDGVIFKGYSKNSNQAVVKGGRYDRLSRQLGYKIPAVGFMLSLEEI